MHMESFGTYLKEERESRKVSLDAISRATKVRRVILEAIEEDQGEALLPEVVIKGFIEAYARHLGLDPQTVLVKYAQWQEGNKATERGGVSSGGKGRISLRYMVAGVIGVVAVVAVVLFVAFPHGPREGAQEANLARPSPEQTPTVSSEGPQPSSSTPVVEGTVKEALPLAPPPPDTQAGHEGASAESVSVPEHTLIITASERTWVQIQEGSALPRDVILSPGDNLTRTSSQQFAVVIGNAGGVTVSFDGRVLTSLGEAGQVVRLTLPAPREG
jgi:cytoskeleton protein RodZ